MTKKLNNALVESWRSASPGKPAIAQYAGPVRAFARQFAGVNVGSIQESELVRYALGISSSASRTKTVTALSHFFDFLTTSGNISRDPARHLAERVRQALNAEVMIGTLVKGGMQRADAQRLTWRDIAHAVFCAPATRQRSVLTRPRNQQVLQRLSGELVGRLRHARIADLDRLLESPVFR